MPNLYNSYKLCQESFKKHSKSYYLGAMIFPFEKFKYISAFYGLVRLIDNIIDTNIEPKKMLLNNFKKDFFNLYDFEDRSRIQWDKYHPIYPAVFDMISKLSVPKELFERFFSAMEMDLMKFKYKNFGELVTYMDGSAIVVADIMVTIMTNNEIFYNDNNIKLLIPHARSLAIAFQLTNFVRDITEDREMIPSRTYLPSNEQEVFNIELAQYTSNKLIDDKFINFIRFQILRCNLFYQYSQYGINELDYTSSKAINLSKILYSNILVEIENKDYKLLDKKIKVSFWKKLYLTFINLGFFNFMVILKNYIAYSYFMKFYF